MMTGLDTILCGDALQTLRTLPDGIAHTCVTSPPYWNLRDYGVPGQLGLEETVGEYVAKLVEVFREVRRVLRPDATLWLNLGDSYANDGKWGGSTSGKHAQGLHGETEIGRGKRKTGLPPKSLMGIPWRVAFALQDDGWILRSDIVWFKPNPMPESVMDRPTRAHEYLFLLARSGAALFWTHRSGMVSQTKPRPDYRYVDRATDEEVADEPADWRTDTLADGRRRWRRVNLWRAHDYYYDAAAIREPLAAKTYTTFGTKHRAQGNDELGKVKSDNWGRTVGERQPKVWKTPAGWDATVGDGGHGTIHRSGRTEKPDKQRGHSRKHAGFNARWDAMPKEQQQSYGANRRDVWVVAPEPWKGRHFATFPQRLIEPCILAGCPPQGIVLDPFFGRGTVGRVARRHSRHYIGIELSEQYCEMAREFIAEERQPVLWTA